MVGQSYKIYLTIEMPESDVNKNLGMFMVCLNLTDKEQTLVDSSCRAVMLHYRSKVLYLMRTFIYSPMLIFGTTEEKQKITVEMFGDFEENQVKILVFKTMYLNLHYCAYFYIIQILTFRTIL